MRSLPSLLVLPALFYVAAPAFAGEYLTVAQAQKALFPEADAFVEKTVQLNDEQRAAIHKKSGVRQRSATQRAWAARKDGRLLGWFIVDEVVGKHEFITYAAALSPQGSVRGVEIMIYRETYGYQIRNADWRAAFTGKTLSSPFKLDEDIPNITGATLSCRNVMNGVKRLLALQQLVLAHE